LRDNIRLAAILTETVRNLAADTLRAFVVVIAKGLCYVDDEGFWFVATTSHSSIAFRLMAVMFGLAVLYHAAALSIPVFLKAAYPAMYPPLRNVAFIIVNSLAAFLFLKRPRWLIWPYLVLTAQVLQGHGVQLWQTWVDVHQINWIDVIFVSGVLLGLVLLILERKDRCNKGAA